MEDQTKWAMNPQNSEIAFKIRHSLIGNIKGAFKIFDAHFSGNNNEIALSKMNLMIDASSIITGDETRDDYLKDKDFLDVKNNKQIKFTSTAINNPDADGNCTMWGELSIKGITKLVKLNVLLGKANIDIWGNKKVGVAISGTIYRSDWGLYWNQTMEPFGYVISEVIIISCGFELKHSVQTDVYKQLGPVVNEQHSLRTGNAA